MSIQPQTKVDIYDPSWPSDWDWPEQTGYTPDTVGRAWTEVCNSGVFWRSLFPYPTAWEDLKFLSKLRDKHDIYFVTTRPGKTAKAESEVWLEAHGFLKPTVIIAQDKQKFCAAVDIDIIVEDKPANLFGHDETIFPILFKRTWNSKYWNTFKSVDSIREALNGL